MQEDTEIPVLLKHLRKRWWMTMEISGKTKDDVDFFVFHQANDFMNNYLMKKMKIPADQVPATIAKYGNTSSVSIPLTIVSELKEQLMTRKTLLLSGFGVGMTWATAILNFDNCTITDIVEV